MNEKSFLDINGGNVDSSSSSSSGSSSSHSIKKIIFAAWGILQVVAILGNALKRLIPIALQPFKQQDLAPYQWIIYGLWSMYMAYVEGYQGFQQKFSPLVIKRAFSLSDNLSIVNTVLAGPYSMGLIGATRKRTIISWSISMGVFAIVKVVKLLPYPWRSIVDSGVVVGLTYGTLSILVQAIKGFCGHVPDVDPCLPDSRSNSTSDSKDK